MRCLLAAAILLLTSCAGPTPTASTSVDLHDGWLESSSTVLEAGSVAIEIENLGELTHTLVITSRDGTVVAATGLVAPGEELDMDLDLAPGAYQFTCRIVAQAENGEIFDHYQLGMSEAITVEG